MIHGESSEASEHVKDSNFDAKVESTPPHPRYKLERTMGLEDDSGSSTTLTHRLVYRGGAGGSMWKNVFGLQPNEVVDVANFFWKHIQNSKLLSDFFSLS